MPDEVIDDNAGEPLAARSTTPTAYEAERVTAARTPSPEAVAAVQEAVAAQEVSVADDADYRTAKEIMNDPDDPRSPL